MKLKTGMFIFFLFTICTIVRAVEKDITGNYRCRGNDFVNHTTFDEPTRLTKTGDTYFFTWANKNTTFYGRAILLNNQLSSVFWTPSSKTAMGVVTYEILPNGDLKGKWTLRELEQTGDEYCEKLK